MVPAKFIGTGNSPNSTGTGPEPEFWSGPNLIKKNIISADIEIITNNVKFRLI